MKCSTHKIISANLQSLLSLAKKAVSQSRQIWRDAARTLSLVTGWLHVAVFLSSERSGMRHDGLTISCADGPDARAIPARHNFMFLLKMSSCGGSVAIDSRA